jgi:putative membrane protein
MKNIILIIKGLIVALANIIPGVSGGTLMITLGIYEEIIDIISHPFKNLKNNWKFILFIGIGVVSGVLVFSKLIKYSLEHFPLATPLFFMGLVLGGIPLLLKKGKVKDNIKVSNIIIMLLTFGIVLLFALLKSGDNVVTITLNFKGVLLLFLVGMIAASSMIIPGISGSFMLMLMGYYKPIIDTISNLTKFNNLWDNLKILIPFGVGIIVGIVLVAKLIEYLLKKFEIKTYFGVIGFVLASIIAILIPLFKVDIKIVELIIGIILMIIGSFATYKISNK